MEEELVNSERYTIELSGFDLKLVLDSLKRERSERLRKTPWKNRNPNGYPPQFGYDYNAKSVRQVDSVINYIQKQI